MSEERIYDGREFEQEMRRRIGQTVTIFTTSGGESGDGFTGVVLSVNRHFVRLITQMGSAPGWPLDNSHNYYEGCNERANNRGNDRGNDRNRGFTLGSVTDIPINRISAFVHNAV